jgi:phage shock protein A
MSHPLYLNGLTVNNLVLSGLADLSSTSSADSAANKRYVDTAIQGTADAAALSVTNLIASAPDALNTLKELATALGDDAAFSVTVTNSLTSNSNAISNEVTRATGAEGVLTTNLAAEATTARAAETANALSISNEVTRATAAEGVLTTNLAAEATTARAAETANALSISNEVTRATAAEGVLRTDLATLDGQHHALQSLHDALRIEHNALSSSTPSTTSFGLVTGYLDALHKYFFDNRDNLLPQPTLPTYDNSNSN